MTSNVIRFKAKIELTGEQNLYPLLRLMLLQVPEWLPYAAVSLILDYLCMSS
jgi:hypothetical protein